MRNQDDEFNLRLIRHGGRILLTPTTTCRYYARDSLRKLWRMYFQYGYFKPLVVRKVRGMVTWRQLAPPAFVFSLLAAGVLAPGAALPWPLSRFSAFSTASCSPAAPRAARKHGLPTALCLCLVFPAIHMSYGFGYLWGAVDFLLRRGSPRDGGKTVSISR